MTIFSNLAIFILLLLLVPTILVIVQYKLSKSESKYALLPPVISACFFFIFGFWAIGLAGVMFIVHFAVRQHLKEKKEREDSINKMNTLDL